MNFLRLFHTVRYLRPGQIRGQLRQRLRARWENPARFAARSAPVFPGVAWTPPERFLPPDGGTNRSGDILDGRLTFVNQPRVTGWPPDWDAPGLPKLWQYNLHYFDWLWVFSPEEFDPVREVVRDWITRHPLDRGRVGWEAYPTALRLVNWCIFFFGVHRGRTLANDEFARLLWTSIHRQAEWLSRHLEYHLLGNHLLEDAAALTVAGSCFGGSDAIRWRNTGVDLLRKELAGQVPRDGLHFERSPMYHSRIVHLLLTVYNTGCAEVQSVVRPFLGPALGALSRTVHPDGGIALLNDSAFGIYPPPEVLLRYAGESGFPHPEPSPGAWSLPDAGYYGFQGRDGLYLLCDAGEIGPSYIPGHAHADIFTYELSLRGCRVVVDAGVYGYEPGEMRRYCRSTRAHNTVEINGLDQSEMWGAFRVARRGRPRDVTFLETADGFTLSGWHDGYRRLPGRPVHHREFVWRDGAGLTVTDRIESGRPVHAVSRIHLHPLCRIEARDDCSATVGYDGGRFRVVFSGTGELNVEESFYCPEFTVRQANITLAYAVSGKRPEMTYTIEPME